MRRRLWLWSITCLLAALFLLAYPIYVIRPFRFQGPTELPVALFILRYRPGMQWILAALSIWLAASAWRQVGHLRRLGLVITALATLACAFLGRINVYEKMFHPLEEPAFSEVNHSKLAADEQVIAVKIQNDARAYPIRILSYHHIVNDKLAGRAIVATY